MSMVRTLTCLQTVMRLFAGSVVPVAARDPGKFQHQGFGTLLMEEAERIAREEHGGWRQEIPW